MLKHAFAATTVAASAVVAAYLLVPLWLLVFFAVLVVREVVYKPTVIPAKPVPALATAMETPEEALSETAKRTCVVTGASGFLAQHLVNYLVQTKSYDVVRAVDIVTPKFALPQVENIQCNITDAAAVRKAIQGAGTVFHVASLIDLRDNKYRNNRLYDVNVLGTVTIINACVQLGVERLVYTSSMGAVVGPKQGYLRVWNEDTLDTPVDELTSHYGKTKRIAELKVLEANGNGGRLRTISLRLGIPFGPGDKLQTEVTLTLPAISKLPKGGNETSFIYCKNWAHWHKLAADKLADDTVAPSIAGQAFFIDNGGLNKDAIMTQDKFNEILIAMRKKNPPQKVAVIPLTVVYVFMVVGQFVDWFTGGKLVTQALMLNEHAVFYSQVACTLDASKLAKLIGYQQLYTIKQAFEETAKVLDP